MLKSHFIIYIFFMKLYFMRYGSNLALAFTVLMVVREALDWACLPFGIPIALLIKYY